MDLGLTLWPRPGPFVSGPWPAALQARVVYFRGATQGACTYMDDRRDAPVPHGACWYDLCPDCEVIDIPGDHFSILRQVRWGRQQF